MIVFRPWQVYLFNVLWIGLALLGAFILFPTTAFLTVVAIFFASLLDPVVTKLSRWRTPTEWQRDLPWPVFKLSLRPPALQFRWQKRPLFGDYCLSRTMVTFILVFGVLFTVLGGVVLLLPQLREGILAKVNEIPLVVQEQLLPNLDRLLQQLEIILERYTWLEFQGNLDINTLLENLPNVTESGRDFATFVVQGLFSHTLHLIEFFLLLFVVFFTTLEWPKIRGELMLFLERATPRSWNPSLHRITNDIVNLSRQLILGMSIVGSILSLIIMIGLPLLADYPLVVAIPVGIICGFLSIIPYIGTTIATLVALFVTFLLNWFSDPWAYFMTLVVVFGVNFILEGKILTPRFVGDRLQVVKVVVILMVAAGGELLGFVGFLIALPILVLLKALFTEWSILMTEFQARTEPRYVEEIERRRRRHQAIEEEILALVRDGVRYRQQQQEALTTDQPNAAS